MSMPEERLQPALGPMFPIAIGAVLAALAAECVAWAAYVADAALPVQALVMGLVVLGCVLGLALGLHHGTRGLAAGCAAFCVIGCCGLLYWAAWDTGVTQTQTELAAGTVRIELTGDPAQRDYGDVSQGLLITSAGSARVRVLWGEVEPLSAGHAIDATGSMSAPLDDEGGRWNHRNGFVGMVSLSAAEDAGYAHGLQGWVAAFRDGAFQRIEDIGGEGAAILAGVLLGNRTLYAGTELEQDFRTTGLAHLMAVSGTHLAVITALASWLLGLSPLRRRWRSMCVAVLLVGYVFLTGCAPSAMRSCLMCGVALASGLIRRRGHVLTGLWLCVVLFLGLDPTLIFSTGYQLSVLAIVGLVVLSPLVSSWLAFLLPARLERLAEPVAATLAATMLTLPITIPLFSQFPLVSPLSTLLAAPLITAALGIGVPAVLLCGPVQVVGDVLLRLAAACGAACAWLVHGLADLPWACVPVDAGDTLLGVVFGAAVVVLWASWPLPPSPEEQGTGGCSSRRPRRAFAAVAIAVPLLVVLVTGLGGLSGFGSAVTGGVGGDAEVIQLDVGQGDCMLIRSGDAAVLIDTGEENDVLLRALARHGVTRLDAVILTHKDADHAGALGALEGVVSVGHVYVHADLLDFAEEQDVLDAAKRVLGGGSAEGLRPGDALHVGSFTLTVLAPQDGGESENADSLVTLLSYDPEDDGVANARALFSGDAEAVALEDVVPQVGKVDFVKAPHHGSRGGLTKTQLLMLLPSFALISVGADNEYGHPTQEMLDLFASVGARIYRTDLQGDLTVTFTPSGLTVTVQK